MLTQQLKKQSMVPVIKTGDGHGAGQNFPTSTGTANVFQVVSDISGNHLLWSI